RRRAFDSAALAAGHVTLDARDGLWRNTIALEARRVEPQVDGVLPQIRGLERHLVGEQGLVHSPELALCRGRLGRRGREPGVGVDLVEGEVPEYEAQSVAELALEGVDAQAR